MEPKIFDTKMCKYGIFVAKMCKYGIFVAKMCKYGIFVAKICKYDENKMGLGHFERVVKDPWTEYSHFSSVADIFR